MSRSYKKTPIYKAHMSGGKKMANDRVRNTKEIPNGAAYKNYFPRWDVIDYTLYRPWEKSIDSYLRRFDSVEEAKNSWARVYYRK